MQMIRRLTRGFETTEYEIADLGEVACGIDYPIFWIDVFHPHGVKQHNAFRARTREQVDSFYEAALLADGVDNGGPGLRTVGYPPGYYAAFVLDPDDNNSEVVVREG